MKLFSLILTSTIDTFAMLNVVLIVEVLYGSKLETNRKKLFFASLLFFFMEVGLEYIVKTGPLVAAIEFAFMAMAAFILAREKRIRATFLTIPAVLVYTQWGYLGDLVEMLLGLNKYYIVYNQVELSPLLLPTELALFLALLFLKDYSAKKGMKISLTKSEGVFLFIFCLFAPILTDIFESLAAQFQNKVYNMAWVIFVLSLHFAVIYAISFRKRSNYYKNLSESYRQHFDQEYTYFKKYKDNNKDMAKFRHDWNNHMIVMQGLLAEGKYAEAEKYFSSFPVISKRKSKKLITGNETVDTILAAKADLFEQYDMELTLDGNLSRLPQMEPVDICILFSNLIDNAIEAASQSPQKRYLHMQVTESPNMLMIVMKNNMQGEPQMDGNTIKTTKTDKHLHGMGLQNAEEIIRKYKGESQILAQNQQFTFKIVLPH